MHGRGNPGTHDISLLFDAINALRNGTGAVVPVYDKSLHRGKGDRSGYRRISSSTDVLLIEGWCLAFTPLHSKDVVDRHVAKYARLHSYLHGMIILEADPDRAYEWRCQAERVQGNGLSDKGVKDMVDRFMPSYQAYLPGMISHWKSLSKTLIVSAASYRDQTRDTPNT